MKELCITQQKQPFVLLHHIQDFGKGRVEPKATISLRRSLLSIQHQMCWITAASLKCIMGDIWGRSLLPLGDFCNLWKKIAILALFERNFTLF